MDVVEEPRSEGGRLDARQSATVTWGASAAVLRLAAVAVPRPPAGAARVRVRVPGGAPACAGQPRRSRDTAGPRDRPPRSRQTAIRSQRLALSPELRSVQGGAPGTDAGAGSRQAGLA